MLGVPQCYFIWCQEMCFQESVETSKWNSWKPTYLVASTLGVHEHKQRFHERRRDRFYHKRTTFIFLLKKASSTIETYIQDLKSSPKAMKVRHFQNQCHPPPHPPKSKYPPKYTVSCFTGLTQREKVSQAITCPQEFSHDLFIFYRLEVL